MKSGSLSQSMEHMTNTQLKRILEKIVVNEHGKVDIYLRLFSDIDLDNSVLFNNNSAYGCNKSERWVIEV